MCYQTVSMQYTVEKKRVKITDRVCLEKHHKVLTWLFLIFIHSRRKNHHCFEFVRVCRSSTQIQTFLFFKFFFFWFSFESISTEASRPLCRYCWQRGFWGRVAAGTQRWRWGGWGPSTTRWCTLSWTAAGSSRRSFSSSWSRSAGTYERRRSPLCGS